MATSRIWSSSGGSARERGRGAPFGAAASRGLRRALSGLVLAGVGWGLVAAGADAGPRIAAHRGGAALWPENSLTAFRGALGLGVDLVELDVHLSQDDEVIVLHDPTLDRTTNGHGPVRERTVAELDRLGIQGAVAEPPPRLRAVAELIRGSAAHLLLEIKSDVQGRSYPGIEARVLGVLAETALTARTTIMAFDWDVLVRLRALDPTVRLTGLLSPRGVARLGGLRPAVERLRALGATDLGVERTLLATETIAVARAAGLTVGVWTVNDPGELRRVLAAGVDYVTTDRPDLALAIRRDGR